MILWHQKVQQDVAWLNAFGVEVDGEVIFQHMQHVMDCLYNVPSAPVFKQTSAPPDLGGTRTIRNLRLILHLQLLCALDSRPAPLPSAPTEQAESSTEKTPEEGYLPKIVQTASFDLLHVEGDRCVGVCFANDEGFYGIQNPMTKRIAVATGKHGIHYIDWDPDERPKTFSPYSTTSLPQY